MKTNSGSSFELSSAKRALLAAMLKEMAGHVTPSRPIPRRQMDSPAPLSFAQERLWFLDRMDSARSDYNISLAFSLKGPLVMTALKYGLGQVIQRHESLRARFPLLDASPFQVIAPAGELDLKVSDLQDLPPGEITSETRRLVEGAVRKPFDLANGPLMRVRVLRLGEADHILAFVLHHIVSDEWSMDVLLRELSLHYTGYLTGEKPELPALSIQYSDYAAWQREQLRGEAFEDLLAYWKQKLADAPPALDLPVDHPRRPEGAGRGHARSLRLPLALLQGLQAVIEGDQGAFFAVLLAAFATLLYRHTGQPDLFLGSPITSRDDVQLEGLVGFFLNTLVLRCDLTGNPSFRELVRRIRAMALEAFDHKDLPFEKLVEVLRPARDLSRNPLFQVMFVYRPAAHIPLAFPGLRLERFRYDQGTAMFDLTLYAEIGEDGLGLNINYNADIFEAETIERMLTRLQTLLEGVAADPDCRINSLPVMTALENELLVAWGRTRADFPADIGLDQLFEAQVLRTADALAVDFRDQRLTYRQLNQQANRLAHYLRAHGVRGDTPVAIYLERSVDMIVSLLAVLKAGSAYLPLDPTYPPTRLAFMLEEARVSLILTQERLKDTLPDHSARVICLEDERHRIARQSAENLLHKAAPDGLAYVIYTSGSTGQPKGVAMGHRALSNLVEWHRQHPVLSRPARTLQLTSLNFDVSFQEIASTLCTGGGLILVSEEDRSDFGRLLQYLQDHSVERLFLPFVALQALAEVSGLLKGYPASLREVITAGERLRITTEIKHLFENLPDCTLHNHYGPTECHLVTAYTLMDSPQNWPLFPPIGRPIANCRVYLLDEGLQPVPIGVAGEVYVGGENQARGYLHQPELTRERFPPNPFPQDDPMAPLAERLYKTGDLARYRVDGELEFLGRRDQQVKIRGYRVEPGEVEAALSDHPGVREAVVIAREDQPGDRRLAAYILPSPGAALQPMELREHLAARLPNYMVPYAFVLMEALPLTSSGKIDRRALPAPNRVHLAAQDTYLAPRDDLERQLVAIWEEVLGLKPIGMHDDFFDLGGHSMLAIRLFALLEERLGQRLPLALLFKSPTVHQLAETLREQTESADWSTLVPIQTLGSQAPFFCVHGFGGGVVGYAALAKSLGMDQPFYGLQARGLDGQEEPDVDIPAMASRYLKAMRELQPSGPYYLGGYCFGGVVAYEIACQLQAQGEQAALVAIFEGYAPLRRQGWGLLWKPKQALNFLRNLPYWFRDYISQGFNEMWGTASRRITRILLNLVRRAGLSGQVILEDVIGEDAADVPIHVRRLMELQIQAQINYYPGPYSGRVDLFRIRRLSLLRGGDPSMGWGTHVSGGVTQHLIPGRHDNILEEPQVESLAVKLNDALVQARSEPTIAEPDRIE